jgi:hypothetical protein
MIGRPFRYLGVGSGRAQRPPRRAGTVDLSMLRVPGRRRALRAGLLAAFLTGMALEQAWGENPSLIITGKLVSTHDRLSPDPLRSIVIERSFSFTLSGRNNVDEHWTSRVLSNERHPQLGALATTRAHESALGEDGGRLSWKVLGAHQIQRISQGKQYVLLMSFTFDDVKKSCKLSAKYVLQQGKTFIVMRRGDSDEFANFSLDRVIATSCAVSS